MTTAAVQYTTLANVKARLAQQGQTFGTQDDTILTTIIGQVSGWIEGPAATGRILGPIPAFASTVSSGGTIGSTSVTLASATGLAAGDALMFGPVSGTHEHQIVAGISGNVVTLQSGLVAAYGGGTAVQRVQLFDGSEALEGGHLIPVANGIVSATSVEVAFYSNGAYNLIPPTDWFLRPTPLDREVGWPATELWMTDIPSSGNPAPLFYTTFAGYGAFATVRVVGSFGWPAIPDEIAGLAEKLTVALWRARLAGGGGQVVVGSDGARTIERLLDSLDWELVKGYTSKEVVLI